MSTLSMRSFRSALALLHSPAFGNSPVLIVSRGAAAQAVESQEKPARMNRCLKTKLQRAKRFEIGSIDFVDTIL